MHHLSALFLFLFSCFIVSAQTTVEGTITGENGEPLVGASIAIKASYDGTSADTVGHFSFTTYQKDTLHILASYLGYDAKEMAVLANAGTLTLHIRLKEAFNELHAVTITAGTFEASDSKRMVLMRPLDIVTTASGGADITAVMQLLPGANRVGEQEGLYVRGGSASETKTVIDGMIVQNPYFSSTPDVPQRGRFSPFQFKGTAFSTGGYSAQYGQALSSVLLLDTQDKTSDASTVNVIAHLAGLGVTYTHKGWITGSLFYSNLTPFLKLVPLNLDFEKVPQGLNGSLTIHQNLSKHSELKLYATYTSSESAIHLPDYTQPGTTYLYGLNNKNFFSNGTYRLTFGDDNWIWLTGFSYSNNQDDVQAGGISSDRIDERTQVRTVLKRLFGPAKQHTILAGVEFHAIRVGNQYEGFSGHLSDNYSAAFAESEFYVTNKLAVRVGFRGEYTSIIDKANLSPRFSIAYKTGMYSQVSLAAGQFYQTPEKNYLYLNQHLGFEGAKHLILNYQIIRNERTFRIELFDKTYENLVREYQTSFDPNPYRFPIGPTDNSGHGYAYGFDVFYRDKKTFKNGDFWVTYSYLDTRRLFQNYTKEAMPTFASNHNFSVVYKQFFPAIMTNLGATYTFTSGRPYYDADSPAFLSGRTKPYHNISLAASYIRMVHNNFWVFFASLDNVLGTHNEFGYRYSADGKTKTPVKPLTYRTLFFGVSINFSKKASIPKESKLDL